MKVKDILLCLGLIGGLILPLFSGCHLEKKCPECFSPPNTFTFRLIDALDSSDLISSGNYSKDSMAIFYLIGKERKEVEFILVTDSTSNKTYLYSSTLPRNSLKGVKDFYLQLNPNDVDTIYLNVEEETKDCCTFHPYKSFAYNGQVQQINPLEQLYLIQK